MSATARRDLLFCALLVAATVVVFWPVRGHAFIAFDDGDYITANPRVRDGWSLDGLAWAFTSFEHANFWHPLTWLSLQADAELFGVDGRLLGLPASGWHHLSNVALHAASAVLLYLFLRRTTDAAGPAALVAGLFALHPLHVESVAWASQRKDTLSTLFGCACLLAYAAHARRPGALRYLLVLLFFVLGLMAKPMLVTWPFVLLLFDFWPLGRLQRSGGGDPPHDAARATAVPRRPLGALLLEKAPLLALSGVASVIAYRAQGTAVSVLDLSLADRLRNGAVSAATYVGKAFWPTGLAPLYPYRAHATGAVLGALGLLAGLTALAAWAARRGWTSAAVGWLFFLGTLVPVSGLVQVGLHARADRYTYVPLVGLFIALVPAAAQACARWRVPRPWPLLAGGLLLCACAVASRRQVVLWADTVTLFRHTVAVTGQNGWAHRILGTALADAGRPDLALPQLQRALAQWPDDPIGHNNLGHALAALGRSQDALAAYATAVRLAPDRALFRANLGNALLRAGALDPAVAELSEALRLDPDEVLAHNALGKALALQGRLGEAVPHFEAVTRLQPREVPGWANLAAACAELGRFDGALAAAERARALASAAGEQALADELGARVAEYRERATP